jgi:hypothetical protein
MNDFMTRALAGRRTLEKVLVDLRAKYRCMPSTRLARMIRRLEAEISFRDSEGSLSKESARQKEKIK